VEVVTETHTEDDGDGGSIVVSTSTATFDAGTGGDVTVTYQTGSVEPRAYVAEYLGGPGQDMSAALQAVFGADIDDTDKFAGFAALVVTFVYDTDVFPSGPPQVSAVMRGAKVFDPRDPDQDIDDATTWLWSENPALIARDAATWANLGNCTALVVPLADVASAANACDIVHTFVTDAGSTVRPMYTCGIAIPTDQSPSAAMDEIVESMAGRWGWAGGVLKMRAGALRMPVASLTEDWLSGQGDISLIPEPPQDQAINIVKPTISDAGQGYISFQAPAVQADAYIALDGQELVREVTMSAVTDADHAQHVGGVSLRDERSGMTLSLPCNLRAFPIELYDTLYVTLPRFGLNNKLFEVLRKEFSLTTGVLLVLKETDASIFDPDALFLDVDATPNSNLPSAFDAPVVTGLVAESGTDQLVRLSDGTVLSRIRVTFNRVQSAAVWDGKIELAYGLADTPESQWQVDTIPGDSTENYLTGVQDGAIYLIKARTENAAGVRSVWSPHIAHQVVGKTEPPADVPVMTVLEQPAGQRSYFWQYDDAPADLAGFEARYVESSADCPWGAMVPMFECGRLDRSRDIPQPPDGEFIIALKAKDTTGNLSLHEKRITALFDSTGLATLLSMTRPHELGWPGTLTDCYRDGYALTTQQVETWDTIPTTWDAWFDWAGTSMSPIVYMHTAIDIGSVLSVRIRAGSVASNTATAEYRNSDDGVTWSAWDAIPGGSVSLRYLQVRWTVAGTFPVLYRAQVAIYS
jgi:hypothetical protein